MTTMKTLALLGIAVSCCALLGPRMTSAQTNHVTFRTNTLEWSGYIVMTPEYTNMAWEARIPECDHSNAVRYLAKVGAICKEFGHNWRDGRQGEGDGVFFADYHPNTYYRTCRTCGRTQSRRYDDWK